MEGPLLAASGQFRGGGVRHRLSEPQAEKAKLSRKKSSDPDFLGVKKKWAQLLWVRHLRGFVIVIAPFWHPLLILRPRIVVPARSDTSFAKKKKRNEKPRRFLRKAKEKQA